MLNTGDFVIDSVAGANVQVLERIEMWGYTVNFKTYRKSYK